MARMDSQGRLDPLPSTRPTPKPQFGSKNHFTLMFKGVPAWPEEPPGQIPNPCRGVLLPSPPSARNKCRKRLDPVSQPLCCLAASWPDIRGPLVTTSCYCSEKTKAGLTYRDWKVKRHEQTMAVRGHPGQHLLFVISKALGRKPFPKKARWIWS